MESEKICFILPSLAAGGAERVSINLVNEWAIKGLDVDLVYCNAPDELRDSVRREIVLLNLKVGRLFRAVWVLKNIFRKKNYTAIYIAMWPLTVYGSIAHKLSGSSAKLILIEHIPILKHNVQDLGLPEFFVRSSVRLLYPTANIIVCVSEGVASELESVIGGKAVVKVIANPVIRLSQLRVSFPPIMELNERERELIGWTRGSEFCLLSVGTLKRQKNFPMMITSVGILRSSGLNVSLVIVGEGPERKALEQHIASLNLEKCVSLVGYRVNVSPFYLAADVFLLSSDYEGLPTVLIEALSFGLSVVSTDCPYGPSEILGFGRYGVLTPTGDTLRFADGVRRCLEDSLPREIFLEAVSRYSIEERSADYLELLSDSTS